MPREGARRARHGLPESGLLAGAFDAGYAFNRLLHVPNAALAAVLAAIRRVLVPGALLYVGTYGGDDFEGILPDDWHDPARFFSFRSDETLLQMIDSAFEVVAFHVVADERTHFQALTVRVLATTFA